MLTLKVFRSPVQILALTVVALPSLTLATPEDTIIEPPSAIQKDMAPEAYEGQPVQPMHDEEYGDPRSAQEMPAQPPMPPQGEYREGNYPPAPEGGLGQNSQPPQENPAEPHTLSHEQPQPGLGADPSAPAPGNPMVPPPVAGQNAPMPPGQAPGASPEALNGAPPLQSAFGQPSPDQQVPPQGAPAGVPTETQLAPAE